MGQLHHAIRLNATGCHVAVIVGDRRVADREDALVVNATGALTAVTTQGTVFKHHDVEVEDGPTAIGAIVKQRTGIVDTAAVTAWGTVT